MSSTDDIAALAAAPTLPSITLSNRPLRDTSAKAMEALLQANDPPVIFTRGDSLVRVESRRDNSAHVVALGEDHLRGHLTRGADFFRRRGGGEEYHVSPPRDVVRDILTAEGLPFPNLTGLIHSPVVRPDGSILATPGFDIATGLFYLPPPGFSLPPIPPQPSRLEVAAAVAELADVFGEFPYMDQASRANALGSLLTLVVRPVIRGSTPLAIYDAPDAGTGKGLHVDVVSIIATGSTAAVTTAPRSEEEWRKRITSVLLGGQPVALLDNIEGILQSPSLAAAITAPMWQDRLLGQNRQVTIAVRVTWMATGNNIKLGGDIPRRCYRVRMDAGIAQPWRRTDFRHPDLVAYVLLRRPQLVAALLTLVRAWDAAGRPKPSIPLGSFQEWVDVVGGVLGVAGVDGFLGNLDRMYEQADMETPVWTAFVEAWRAHFGEQEVTAAAVIEATAGQSPTQVRLRDALPGEVVDAKPERRSRALGIALAHREDRRYGSSGLRVVRAGTEQRAVRWRVVEGVSQVSPRTAEPRARLLACEVRRIRDSLDSLNSPSSNVCGNARSPNRGAGHRTGNRSRGRARASFVRAQGSGDKRRRTHDCRDALGDVRADTARARGAFSPATRVARSGSASSLDGTAIGLNDCAVAEFGEREGPWVTRDLPRSRSPQLALRARARGAACRRVRRRRVDKGPQGTGRSVDTPCDPASTHRPQVRSCAKWELILGVAMNGDR